MKLLKWTVTAVLVAGGAGRARAETVETGDNWRQYTFSAGDLTKYYGSETGYGWGVTASPYIQLACFVGTPGKTFVGPGKLTVDLGFYSTTAVDVEAGQGRPTYGLAGVVVTYQDEAGEQQVAAPINALELADLPHWVYVSSDGEGGSVYYASTNAVQAKTVLRDFHFTGKAVNVQVSVCNVMPRTDLSVHGVVVHFEKDQ